MKKKALIIYSWIIISVIGQVFAYLFIDKVYLGNRKNFTATMKITTVATSGESTEVKEEVEEARIGLPENADSVKVSYDGAFVAFMLDKKLHIMDIGTGQTKKVIENQFVNKDNPQSNLEANITSFHWVPISGKNTIIYGVSAQQGTVGRGQLLTYDADTENEHIGITLYDNYIPRDGVISDIIISPLTMVYYAKVRINDSQDRLIRLNIMDEVGPSIVLNSGATIKIGYFSEDLYYEEAGEFISVKSGFKAPYQIKTGFRAALLGIAGIQQHGKDNIYIGQLNEENRVDKIFYGTQDTDTSSWKSISLEQALEPENIIVKGDGEIFCIDPEKKSLSSIKWENKVTFTGEYVDIVNGHLVYKNGSELKFRPFNKK